MTPFELDILLHYHSICDEHSACLANVPIWKETRDWMLKEGLLIPANGTRGYATYRTGERAEVLLAHIFSLPLPMWQMPKEPT